MKQDQLSILLEEEYFTERKKKEKAQSAGQKNVTVNRKMTQRKRRHKKRRRLLFQIFELAFFLVTLLFTVFLAARVKSLLSGSETSGFSVFNSVDAFSAFTENTGITAGSMTGITIVIDPGHGGRRSGLYC